MKGDYSDDSSEGVQDEGVNEVPRAELKPSTVETIRNQLEFQRQRSPSWLAYHFPDVDRRGTQVDYADVDHMSERQADSVRHLLANGIVYGRGRIRKRKAQTFGLGGGAPEPDDEWSIRVRQLEEALKDLCAAFGWEPPL